MAVYRIYFPSIRVGAGVVLITKLPVRLLWFAKGTGHIDRRNSVA